MRQPPDHEPPAFWLDDSTVAVDLSSQFEEPPAFWLDDSTVAVDLSSQFDD